MDQPRWLELAWGDLGIAEAAGANSNPNVVRYYADVGHAQIKDDETAWCAAFLGACLERAGHTSTRSLMARSYLAWGEPLDEFRHGAVAVLSRTADPAFGHAGFLIGETADSVILLGGCRPQSTGIGRIKSDRAGCLFVIDLPIGQGLTACLREFLNRFLFCFRRQFLSAKLIFLCLDGA